MARDLYFGLKESILKVNDELIFNPQKYYISIRNKKNIAYIKFRKKYIEIVIMREEEELRNTVRTCRVKSLGSGVQRFYNGSSASVLLEKQNQFTEICECLMPLMNKI